MLAVLPRGTAADRTRLDVLRVLIDVDNLRLANAEHGRVIEAVDLAEQWARLTRRWILTHYRLLPATGTTDDEILGWSTTRSRRCPTTIPRRSDSPHCWRATPVITGHRGCRVTVAGDVEAALVRARLSGNRSAIGTTLYGLATILLGSPD